jgi:subtilisin family serine protease
MRRARITPLLAALAVIAILAPTPSARATLEISITSGAFTTTIIDQMSGDQNTGAGLIQVDVNPINTALAAAGIRLKFTDLSALSSLPANAPGATLSMNGGLLTTGAGGGTVTIAVTDTGYTRPPTLPMLVSTASDSFARAGGTRTFESWFSPTNGEFDEGAPAPMINNGLSGTGSFAETTTAGVSRSTPFGLTHETVMTLHGGNASFIGKTTILAAPPPALAPAEEPDFGPLEAAPFW